MVEKTSLVGGSVQGGLEEILDNHVIEAVDIDNIGVQVYFEVGMVSGVNGTFVGEAVRNFGYVGDSYVSANLSDRAAFFRGKNSLVHLKSGTKPFNINDVGGTVFVLENFTGELNYPVLNDREDNTFYLVVTDQDIKFNHGDVTTSLEKNKVYTFAYRDGNFSIAAQSIQLPLISGVVDVHLLGKYAYIGNERGVVLSQFQKDRSFETPFSIGITYPMVGTKPIDLVKILTKKQDQV